MTKGSPDNPLTGDHIIPVSRGGTNEPRNIRVLCRTCNSRRGNRMTRL
ncbi:HNH endonuclease [Kitasatospora sp. MBT66]